MNSTRSLTGRNWLLLRKRRAEGWLNNPGAVQHRSNKTGKLSGSVAVYVDTVVLVLKPNALLERIEFQYFDPYAFCTRLQEK